MYLQFSSLKRSPSSVIPEKSKTLCVSISEDTSKLLILICPFLDFNCSTSLFLILVEDKSNFRRAWGVFSFLPKLFISCAIFPLNKNLLLFVFALFIVYLFLLFSKILLS